MITIKNKSSIAKMKQAGSLLSKMFDEMTSKLISGVTTIEIDEWIEAWLRRHNLTPRTKGYCGYKYASCISVNEVVIHGVPSKKTVLRSGDLVKVDVVASFKGYCADMARSFFVDNIVSEPAHQLIVATQSALDKGIEMARAGNHVHDISAAIEKEVERHGFVVIRDFAGHGIGKMMHEDPEVPNFGEAGTGPVLRAGMAIAIEPMVTIKNYEVDIMNDGWTVKTRNRRLAAHIEDTVVITNGDPKILTRRNDRVEDGTQ